MQDVRSEDLHLYLDDFMALSPKCRFTSCTHTAEPDCAVKQAVADGKLYKARYDRYVEEYNQLKENEKNQY